MAATYRKNPTDGVVHLVDPAADGEFTFCSLDHGQEDEGGFEGENHNGPATCRECRTQYDKMRDGMLNVRWRLSP